MNTVAGFEAAFERCPLVAILRGVPPAEVVAIGTALVDAGFTLIEVPLNSPAPFDSIARLSTALGDRAVVGAGTVLASGNVEAIAVAGGRLVVAPNVDADVIGAAAAAGMVVVPGIATPTEAFTALALGAHALKLFPAEAASPSALKAMLAVLPPGTRILPVGGIDTGIMTAWQRAGAAGFGLGSALYVPGRSADEVGSRARALVAAFRTADA